MKNWLFRSSAVSGGILMVAVPIFLFRIWWIMRDNDRMRQTFSDWYSAMYGPREEKS